MPLHLPSPPKNSTILVQQSILPVVWNKSTYLQITRHQQYRLKIGLPLKVFSLGLRNILQGTIGRPRQKAWRYLVMDQDKPVFSVRLDLKERKELEFSSVGHGQFVRASLKAIRRAFTLMSSDPVDFEVRQLEIHALGVVALWFHGKNDDRFMALPSRPTYLEPYRLYTPKTFLSKLRGPARKKSKITDDRA